jgi:hypothetical protein
VARQVDAFQRTISIDGAESAGSGRNENTARVFPPSSSNAQARHQFKSLIEITCTLY